MSVLTPVSGSPDVIEHQAENRYFDRNFGMPAVKILPGEFFVTTTQTVLVTVLGSCVAACIRDRERGIGGMNHFMLPDGGREVAGTSARYGVYAMELLVNQILKLGGRRSALEAKVFGGGRVMASLAQANVGERNAEFVLEFLKNEGIPVVARDLLDVHPRKVYFFPETGRVLVKRLVRVNNATVVRREREYQARLRKADVAGEVELFD